MRHSLGYRSAILCSNTGVGSNKCPFFDKVKSGLIIHKILVSQVKMRPRYSLQGLFRRPGVVSSKRPNRPRRVRRPPTPTCRPFRPSYPHFSTPSFSSSSCKIPNSHRPTPTITPVSFQASPVRSLIKFLIKEPLTATNDN